MFVSCVCCVLCRCGHSDELITCSEESYWMCMPRNIKTRLHRPDLDCFTTEKLVMLPSFGIILLKITLYLVDIIY
jgi:hypothetical protein